MNDSPELAITDDPPRAQYRHCVRWPGIALEGRWFLNHRAEVPLPRISESLRPSKYASLWKIQKATNIVQILCRCFSI